MIHVAQKVFLSSVSESYRQNGSKKSSFRFPFNARFRDHPTLSHVSVRLTSAEIPVSFYLIDGNVGANTVTVNGNVYTIPDGNYTASELLSWWASSVYPSELVSLSFTSKTGLLTFAGTNFTLQATAYRVFGLEDGVEYSAASSLTSPYLADLYGTRRLLICLPNFVLDNQTDSGLGSVLCSVQKDVSAFQVVQYRDESGKETLVRGNVTTLPNYIDLEIRGETGQEMDFNGVDSFLTLEFVFYFDPSKRDVGWLNSWMPPAPANEVEENEQSAGK